MRVGLTLPQFAEDATAALTVASRAEELGLDGVFCFDHLWPMDQPGRPAIAAWPLLGALVATTRSITVGTLVARIGLLPDDLLEAALGTLATLSGGRFIAGLGTGDHHSAPENLAFGVAYEPAHLRRRRLEAVARRTVGRGIPVWIGGGARATVDVARRSGCTVNLWGGSPDRVAALSADGLTVNWGGLLDGEEGAIAARLSELAEAGATWAVAALPSSLDVLAAAARMIDRS